MPKNETTGSAVGDWFHSHEEDEGGNMVFRKSTFDFPLSRGRIGFRLGKGGHAETISIGSDDLPVNFKANWRLQNSHEIIINGEDFAGLLQNSKLILLGPDKIILQRGRAAKL